MILRNRQASGDCRGRRLRIRNPAPRRESGTAHRASRTGRPSCSDHCRRGSTDCERTDSRRPSWFRPVSVSCNVGSNESWFQITVVFGSFVSFDAMDKIITISENLKLKTANRKLKSIITQSRKERNHGQDGQDLHDYLVVWNSGMSGTGTIYEPQNR